MKKIFVIFLSIVGIYILFSIFNNTSLLPFSNKGTEADVSDRIDNIEFDISATNMTIIPEERNNLEAKLEGKGNVTVDQSGDTIKVEYKRPWFSWFSFFSDSKLEVYIPEDYNNNILVDMAAGNLNFSGQSKNDPMELKDLKLEMSAGNVELNNLSVEKFSHDSSAGNATIEALTSKSSSFDISAGNVKVKEFTGGLKVDMSAGKFDMEMDELTDSADIDMSAGTVILDLPEDADFTLNGKLSAGDISYDFPLDVQNEDKRNIKATHGKGTHAIDIKVSSGSVNIK